MSTLTRNIKELSQKIGCDYELIYSIILIESNLKKDAHRFEPHVFKRIAKENNIRFQSVSTYDDAIKIDDEISDISSSWGYFQIMGFHYSGLGYETISDFVNDMLVNESAQIDNFYKYITEIAPQCKSALRTLDFQTFAYYYNGPSYEQNSYDSKLKTTYESLKGYSLKILKKGSQGASVSYLQKFLGDVTVDGIFQNQTEKSVIKFQQSKSIVADGIVGKKTWEALSNNDLEIFDFSNIKQKTSTIKKTYDKYKEHTVKITSSMAIFYTTIKQLIVFYGPYILATLGILLLLLYVYLTYKEYKDGKQKQSRRSMAVSNRNEFRNIDSNDNTIRRNNIDRQENTRIENGANVIIKPQSENSDRDEKRTVDNNRIDLISLAKGIKI